MVALVFLGREKVLVCPGDHVSKSKEKKRKKKKKRQEISHI